MKKINPLRTLPENAEARGNIVIHLDKLMAEKGVSINQLSFRSELQRTQIRRYRDNKIQRLDMDILVRLCYVLECDLSELIEYVPYK